MRRKVAQHPHTLSETLEKLSTDKSVTSFKNQKFRYFVREAVASNPNTAIETLRKLAQDDDEIVRSQVAINPNTSKDILRQLADDLTIIFAYEGNTYETYYKDASQASSHYQGQLVPPVRLAVASNPNTPMNILEKLSQDENKQVRYTATTSILKIKNPHLFTCPIFSNFTEAQHIINTILKSIEWTPYKLKNYLLRFYGKDSQELLEEEELCDLILRLQKFKNSPFNINS